MIEHRLNEKTLGFGAEIKNHKERRSSELLQHVAHEDLIKYGLIPEFVGRLPVVATLGDLDEDALVRILSEPKNSLVRQYQTILGFEGVELGFTDDALDAVVEQAMERKVGARGLRIILEELMLDIMYQVPSVPDVKELVISREVVERRVPPLTAVRKVS